MRGDQFVVKASRLPPPRSKLDVLSDELAVWRRKVAALLRKLAVKRFKPEVLRCKLETALRKLG
jgi:hypothetical protein